MNKIVVSGILSLCLLGSCAFGAMSAEQTQQYINKTVADWKKSHPDDRNNSNEESKNTADDGYMDKEGGASAQSPVPPKQPIKTKKVVKATKPVKSVVPRGAKVVHLRASLSVQVPKDKYVILDFPFNITTFEFKGLKSATPMPKKTVLDLPEEAKDKIDSPVDFEQKGNRIIINSKVAGSGQMIVWGGSYPVIVDLTISSKGGNDYYSFVDSLNTSSQNEVKKLENKEHQKVLNILSVALYRDKTPKGYEKIEEKDVLNYPKEKVQIVKAYSLVGKFYVAEKWYVVNKDKNKPLNLYEEMFYMPDVYSVSILSDRVEPKKSTAVYVVRKRSQEQ